MIQSSIDVKNMPPQIRRVRLSLPKPFKTRWSTRSSRKGPALVSPASVCGSLGTRDGDDADTIERLEGLGDDEDNRMVIDIEDITPVESLESSVSWNDDEAKVDSNNLPVVATIEYETNEVTRRVLVNEAEEEETFYSTTTSISTTMTTEADTTVVIENINAAAEIIVSDLTNEDPALVCDAPVSVTNSTNIMGDAISDRTFKKGDRVRVVKGHKKYGMSGIIFKTTKAFVFFSDDETNERVQIKPQSISFVDGDSPTQNRDEARLQPQQQPSQNPASSTLDNKRCISENNHRRMPSQSSLVPTDFPKRSSVVVDSSHSKHAGKVGIVEGHTKCYVNIKFSNDRKVARVMPKFLTLIEGENRSISTSQSTETTSSDITDGNEAQLDGVTESVEASRGIMSFNLRKFVVKKIILGPRTPSTCAFEAIWDKRDLLPPLEMPLTDLPEKQLVNGKTYELYSIDVGEDDSGFSKFNKKKTVTAYYVCSANLREHEEKLADFGSLKPHKVVARRSLLFSPAMKIGDKYAINPIRANDLVMADDLGTAGCGFISEQYLEDLLGNNKRARTAIGVQMRIFVPSRGIFKGVLIRKRNMQVPIELNDSLLKVGPSRSPDASDNGWIVITRAFPSTGNYTFARVFERDHKPLPKSFRNNVEKEESFKMSPMYQDVMESLGVPTAIIESYRKVYRRNAEKIQHTHLVGMADPTSQLPPNTVFMTGIRGLELDELFVTRSPCMESKDGRVLRVVTTKPESMSTEDWEWLQNLSFGALIFANPKSGDRPMPELIADGDLDGDLYFVCWNKTILAAINSIPITDDELATPLGTQAKEKQYNPEWFDQTQRFLAVAPTHYAGIDILVGKFHNLWKKVADINDASAICFASASKQALDLKTHGGLIYLPSRLWDNVHEKLHHYLTTDENL